MIPTPYSRRTILDWRRIPRLLIAALISLLFCAAVASSRADVFTSSTPITVNDATAIGTGNPYPATINVNGLTGTVTKVTVNLKGVFHTFPDDLDLLLVGPQGQNIIIMSDVGGGFDINNIQLTIDDSAAASLPDSTVIFSGTYKPTNIGAGDTFPAPAPAPSANNTLAQAFNGTDPNGDWQLYVVDDLGVDTGYIRNGWSLTVTTANDGPTAFTNANLISAGDGARGRATPYGGGIEVSGLPESLTTVKVTLKGLSHLNPDDLDVMLVAPNGASLIILSDAGGTADAVNVDLTLDDAAAGLVPDAGPMVTGTFKPSNYGAGDTFPDLYAPYVSAGPASDQTLTSTFKGINPNGTWRLYVVDDATTSTGSLTGWSIDIAAAASPAGTVPLPGQLVISEFHGRGGADQSEEFIELYNTTTTALTVKASDSSGGLAVASSEGFFRGFIPNGTTIPAHGHFLIGSAYVPPVAPPTSIYLYPAGNDGTNPTTATRNAIYGGDIPDDIGIALFTSTLDFSFATRLDAFGPASEANPLFREGAGFPTLILYPANGGTTTASASVVRRYDRTTGLPIDTNDNAQDFVFVETLGTTTSSGQQLGSPGPENLTAPIYLGNQIAVSAVDPGAPGFGDVGTAAGQVRNLTPVTNGAFGTLAVHRKITNNSGVPLTRLRFRLIDLTTSPADVISADLRALSSSGSTLPLSGGGSAAFQGLTLETPPLQTLGGGLNSSLSVSGVTLATPLAPGASINVEFLFGVQKVGAYDFTVIAETLPAAGGIFSFSTKLSVTTTANDGPGSVRQAYRDILATADAGAILFSNGTAGGAVNFYDGMAHTIAFTNGALHVDPFLVGATQYQPFLAIQGPGADRLTLSGNSTSRIFEVTGTGTVIVDAVTLSGGNGGAIANSGALTVSRSIVAENTSSLANNGGALTNTGTLTVSDSTITANSFGGTNGAGAIYSSGTLTILQSTISGNATGEENATSSGAILNANGTLAIIRSTIIKNSNPTYLFKSGILTSATSGPASLALRSSIVAGNGTTDLNFEADGGAVSMTSNGKNIVGTAPGGMAPTPNLISGDRVFSGGQTLAQVLSETLSFNGGHTPTHALVAGSPAIDGGENVTTLTAALDSFATTLTVADSSAFFPTAGLVILIDAEQLVVTSKAGNTLTVFRGRNGTSSAAHATGAVVNPAFDQRGLGFGRTVAGAIGGQPPFVSDIGPVEYIPSLAVSFNLPQGGLAYVATAPSVDLATASGAQPPGGTFTGPGVSNGRFDPSLVGPGIYTITYTSGGLSDTFTVKVDAPAGATVTNVNDDGSGSLRRALRDLTAGGTIDFSSTTNGGAVNFYDGTPRTLTLTSGALSVASNVNLQGPGADRLTISGSNTSRILEVTAGTSTVAGLTLTQGNSGALANSATLTVSRCVLSENTGSLPGNGGAITNSGTLTVSDCTLAGNTLTAPSGGGALYNSGTATIVQSTLSGNSTAVNDATSAGAILNASGALSIIQSTITQNTNPTFGAKSGILDAGSSGGTASLVLSNSIVAGNGTGDLNFTSNSGGVVSLASNGRNLVGVPATGSVPTPGLLASDKVLSSTGTALATVLSTTLGANGGPTPTHALVAGSPAIDSGDDSAAVNAGSAPLENDQRGLGFNRFVQGRTASTAPTVDIGAYEYVPGQLPAPTFAPGLALNGLSLGTNDPALDLSGTAVGASPAGGTFTGTGVVGSTFTPGTLTPGQYVITYTTAPDADGFTASAQFTITVSDNTPPKVLSVSSATANGFYRAGQAVDVTITLSEAVTVTATPQLALATGGAGAMASYVSGSGTAALTFSYTIAAGENAADLDAEGTTALALNGGTIMDAAGNAAILALPAPGAAGSLSANKDLIIDTTRPTVTISAPSVNGTRVGPVTFTVNYADTNSVAPTLAAGDISLLSSGTATGSVNVSGTGTQRTVTVSNITGDGSLAIGIPSGTASDAAGNLAVAAGPSAPFSVTSTRLVTDDHAFGTGKKAVTIDVLANDLAGGGIALSIVTPPKFGTATIVNGKLLYTPKGALPLGGDTITYQYDNGQGGIATGTVSIVNFATIAGTYDGLVENIDAPQEHHGFLRMDVSRTGAATALITMGGVRYSRVVRIEDGTNEVRNTFGAALDSAGNTRQRVPRSPWPIDLTLHFDPELGTISGTVASIGLDGQPFTSTVTLAPRVLTGIRAGVYTLRFDGDAGTATPIPPAGTSFARTVVTKLGVVRLTGVLADGTPFTSGSFLHRDEHFAIYTGIYGAKYRGSLRGELGFANPAPVGAAAAGVMTWVKPRQPTDARFPEGFTHSGAAFLSAYQKPGRGEPILGFPLVANNGYALLVDGGLPVTVDQPFTLQGNNVATAATPNPRNLKLRFDTNTGFFSGSFTAPGSVKPTAFRGAVFQDAHAGSGFFLGKGKTDSGAIDLEETK